MITIVSWFRAHASWPREGPSSRPRGLWAAAATIKKKNDFPRATWEVINKGLKKKRRQGAQNHIPDRFGSRQTYFHVCEHIKASIFFISKHSRKALDTFENYF